MFCKILLNRLRDTIDPHLRKEQAGFRKGRGCTDQIFALRNIIEQCLEWNAPLHINFVDYQKAFDSIHRESLWKILSSYGVPSKIVQLIRCFYDHFECSILLEQEQTEWFEVKSGVRQGCILSPILFLVVIDWVMRQTTSDSPRGIQWTLTSFLEDLDFADDLALLAVRFADMQEKTSRLNEHSKPVGLSFNVPKTKLMSINTNPPSSLMIDGKPIGEVDDFVYLGSLVSKDSGTQKDIRSRIGKARSAFLKLNEIWKSSIYSIRTKVRLYNSNVKSVLLYGSECWRTTVEDMSKLASFHNGCLRRICRIFWPNKVSNKDLYERTKSGCILDEIRRRRFRWLGHVLRMQPDCIPKVALRWTPQGRRKRGRPKNTWRRTMTKELETVSLSWDTATRVAKDRGRWKDLVMALCPNGDKGD